MKPDIYAAARIPAFWRVDLGPLTVTEHHLVEGAYVPVQVVTSGDLVVERPFPLRVDLDPLRALLG